MEMISRAKVAGSVLGLMAFGGILGMAFTGYGSFAGASGTAQEAPAAQAVTVQSTTQDAQQQDEAQGDKENVTKEDMLHYADLLAQNFATELGVDRARLDAALQAAMGRTIDQAVADGKLSAEDAALVRTKLGSAGFSDLIAVPVGYMGDEKGANLAGNDVFRAAIEKALDAGAGLLGVSREEFEKAMHDGGLQALAAEHNVTLDALQSTIETALRAALDEAVAAGKLEQAAADEMYEAFTTKFGYILRETPVDK